MLRPILTAFVVMPVLMGCAIIAQAQDLQNRSPDELALINNTCTTVMGLRKGETYWADCQDSLSHSVARRDAVYAMAASDEICSRQGLKPGSAAFATCMLDNKPAASPPSLHPVAFTSEAIQPGKSYYDLTPSAQFQRKRYACAQLGLTPGGGLFGECVSSLEGALLPDSP
jgi:hypothetical protein